MARGADQWPLSRRIRRFAALDAIDEVLRVQAVLLRGEPVFARRLAPRLPFGSSTGCGPPTGWPPMMRQRCSGERFLVRRMSKPSRPVHRAFGADENERQSRLAAPPQLAELHDGGNLYTR